MKEVKVDPRIRRTRKLIMDVFIELSKSNIFKATTVSKYHIYTLSSRL